eukprot:m.191731 g.191731  ORF g.191731 m.191731 type:complete len:69 (+) comp14847_c0_seq10:1354-1560(+)
MFFDTSTECDALHTQHCAFPTGTVISFEIFAECNPILHGGPCFQPLLHITQMVQHVLFYTTNPLYYVL